METTSVDVLLTCLVRSPSFRTLAVDRAGKLDLFDTVRHPGHALVWDALRRAHAVAGPDAGISVFHLREEIKARHAGTQNEALAMEMVALVDGMAAVSPDDINQEIAQRYFEAAMLQAVKVSMAERLRSAGDRKGLVKALGLASDEIAKATSSEETVVELPLMNPVRFMPEQVKLPTGVRWIDTLSGGGHVRGSFIGYLMPTGGGKTLTATDLVVAQAKRQKHSVLFLYEQGIHNDVAARLFCRMFDDRDIDFFRNTQAVNWSKEDKVRYCHLAEAIGPYVHVVDFASTGNRGVNGVRDVEEVVVGMQEQGMGPDYVIVDWLWPMVMRYCASNGISSEEGGLRHAALLMLDQMRGMGKRLGVIPMVFHQLKTTKARANPSVVPSVTDAMEVGTFSYFMDACYVAGNRDIETNVMWLTINKSRFGAPQNVLGHMIGERGVIELAENMVADFRGRFVDKDNPIPEALAEGGRDDQGYI